MWHDSLEAFGERLLCGVSAGGQGAGSKAGPTRAQSEAFTNTQNATQPVLQQVSDLFQKVMSTGQAAGPQIPIVQRGVEAARNATAQTQRSTDANLAGSNITGPYARSISEGVREQGSFDVSQIVPNFLQQWLGAAPNFGLGAGSPVLGNSMSGAKSSSGGGNAGVLSKSSGGSSSSLPSYG